MLFESLYQFLLMHILWHMYMLSAQIILKAAWCTERFQHNILHISWLRLESFMELWYLVILNFTYQIGWHLSI